MVAWMMRALLAAEALAWVLVAGTLVASRGWGTGAALACCAALSLAARVLIIGAGFAVARPRPGLGDDNPDWTARGVLRAFGNELGTALRYYSWYGPLAPALVPASTPYADPDRPPLVLVHGYTCNRGVWWSLAPRLRAEGWSVHTLDLEPAFASIDDYVDPLARRIDAIRTSTGQPRVIVVAHSMGGLVARAYLARHGDAAVERVLTLGTPHGGTRHAGLGIGVNAWQMQCGSPWLAELAAGEDAARRRLFTCVASWTDNLVAPQASARLEGARNLAVAGVAHLALLTDRDTRELVLAELRAAALSKLTPPRARWV